MEVATAKSPASAPNGIFTTGAGHYWDFDKADVSGRGLFLVEALTNRWGIHEGTTHVWFELAAGSDASRQPRPRLGQDERPQELD